MSTLNTIICGVCPNHLGMYLQISILRGKVMLINHQDCTYPVFRIFWEHAPVLKHGWRKFPAERGLNGKIVEVNGGFASKVGLVARWYRIVVLSQ